MLRSSFLLTGCALWTSVTFAANDWTKPCFDGECAYDLPDSTGTSGILKLFASPNVLTDITPAAGWVILDCDPNKLEQDIRLVCQDDHAESACQHLFAHEGPVNKVVRLPEDCGNGPFARIVHVAPATDQSLPAAIAPRMRRRDGIESVIHNMTIDGDFHLIDHTRFGDVNLVFIGVNSPGIDLNEAFDDGLIGDIIGGIQKAKAWVSEAVDTVGKVIIDTKNWVDDKVKDISNLIKDKANFNIKPEVKSNNITLNAKPLDWTKPLSLGKCPVGRVGVELTSKGWIQGKVGIVLVGSLLKGEITDMAAFGGVHGQFNAHLHLELLLTGGFTVDEKIIDAIGIPGFSLPKIITVGPFISLRGKIQGHIEIDLDVDFDVDYKLNGLELFYPESAAKKYGRRDGIESKDSELSLDAAASITAQGFIQGTVTPQINLGLSIGGGKATAHIHLGADAWVRASIHAVAEASASLTNKRDIAQLEHAESTDGTAVVCRHRHRHRCHRTRDEQVNPPKRRTPQQRLVSLDPPRNPRSRLVGDLFMRSEDEDDRTVSSQASFRGCFWIDAGLHLFGGAEGRIWKWSAGKDFTIWNSPPWQLFEKCWGFSTSDERFQKTEKPKYTLLEVDKLSRAKKNCPTGKKKTAKKTDKVKGKKLQG